MLDRINSGHRVLTSRGTEQTLMAARVGRIRLATDIAERMLAYLNEAANNEC
jgi:hypothetical protein